LVKEIFVTAGKVGDILGFVVDGSKAKMLLRRGGKKGGCGGSAPQNPYSDKTSRFKNLYDGAHRNIARGKNLLNVGQKPARRKRKRYNES